MKLRHSTTSQFAAIAILSTLVFAQRVTGALPAEVYVKRILDSSIQGIVTAVEVKRTGSTKWSEQCVARFRVEQQVSLPGSKRIPRPGPAVDKGTVVMRNLKPGEILEAGYSSVRPGAIVPPGGERYFSIRVGDRAFLTMTSFGSITSYTVLSEQLEKVLKTSPKDVQVGPGGVSIRR